MSNALAALEPVTKYQVTKEDSAAIAELAEKQEALTRFIAFSDETAWLVGTSIRSAFLAKYGGQGLGVVIHIETFTGHTLFSAAVGNPPVVGPDNWNWVRAKFNVVKRFGVSSLQKGRWFAAQGREPESKGLHFPEYACHGGGFPIWIAKNDVCPIGAIVVSGLPQLEDHQLIVDTLAKLENVLA